MMQITEEELLGYMMVNSSHGTLSFVHWCEHEIARLKRAGIHSEIKYKNNALTKEQVCYIVRKEDSDK